MCIFKAATSMATLTFRLSSGRNGVALLSLTESEVENIREQIRDNSGQNNELRSANAQLHNANAHLRMQNVYLCDQNTCLQSELSRLYASESYLRQYVEELQAMLKVFKWQEEEEFPKLVANQPVQPSLIRLTEEVSL
ncbi:hypothetical protein EYZ11_011863 [Aspergillus tanneri]|uniref:Uncharacterized protein n=1 Tax=Aspergillus tanneri TaxID=1220188 RepID=A0A4V3UMU8_9EURO|nr:uncharacterized protein ATNIH1004_008036 [Aspergillus tanneri]KAA8646603.1 hypothetical protein ATNIH1004_008036 [Aspergillus tanneri]THC88694.1 hypothetical protein EYZ11_011863 [Aspergillus tanneri]